MPTPPAVPFEQLRAFFEMYSETAKSITQLSTGALLLSITFLEKVIGERRRMRVDWTLLLSWLAYLVAIGSGAAYQYLAVKRLALDTGLPDAPGLIPTPLIDAPGRVFGVMLVAFYAGALLLTVAAARRLWDRGPTQS
jgi:hypothetical protein